MGPLVEADPIRVRAHGLRPSPPGEKRLRMAETARKACIVAIVVGAVVVAALALWKLRLLIALLFLAFIVAAAMRSGIERLKARGVPRGAGLALHYLVLIAAVVALVAIAVPVAAEQVTEAVPEQQSELREEARDGLERIPSRSDLADPEVGLLGIEIAVGILFVLASAAYWIFERDRAVDLVTSLLPRPRRRVVRATWDLIDLKLGAYVRGQALLIALVAIVLSSTFWLIGLPYWLLVGVFAGVVEIVPVIGPLLAGALAVGVGLTESVEVAVLAGAAVLIVRLLEDYVVIPRVLGDAVGLSPLLVLVSVSATALLFGEFAVLLAIPLAAVIGTLVEVVVLEKDPEEEEVPTVIFAAKEAETTSA
jgi:predicted PurR-regulated permease PerM